MTTFKVGDRVQIRRADDLFFGHLGIVTDCTSDLVEQFFVKINDAYKGWYLSEELASPATATEAATGAALNKDEAQS